MRCWVSFFLIHAPGFGHEDVVTSHYHLISRLRDYLVHFGQLVFSQSDLHVRTSRRKDHYDCFYVNSMHGVS
jgi:hypothetical protein